MGDLSLEKVSETYLDVLKEIGNIGAGNAMTALSQMLNCKVDMKVWIRNWKIWKQKILRTSGRII